MVLSSSHDHEDKVPIAPPRLHAALVSISAPASAQRDVRNQRSRLGSAA